MDLGLDGRVYLVTGGSSGLGRATAEVLVAEGARVVVSGRHRARLDDVVAMLGDSAVGVVADNAAAATPEILLTTARERFGRVDGALISVGGPAAGTVFETTEEEWTSAYHSVLLGGLRLGREIGGALGSGGSLAFVLSTSVREPLPGLAISNGLRPGLAMVAKALADALGPRGVRVNGLLPSKVDTERVRFLDDQAGDALAARKGNASMIPLGRYGEPEEFGRAAAFLLSPAASFITGVMLPVDGGMLRSL